MKRSLQLYRAQKRFDVVTLLGFLVPFALAVLIGILIHTHSKPIPAPLTQTTNPSGGVTATAPASPPSASEIVTANAAILAYCSSDLRQDTSCALVDRKSVV